MRVRFIGLREHYEPTPAELDEMERGFKRRHVMNPISYTPNCKTVLVADLRCLGEWDSGFDVRLDLLPEGAKIGDEFDLEFKRAK